MNLSWKEAHELKTVYKQHLNSLNRAIGHNGSTIECLLVAPDSHSSALALLSRYLYTKDTAIDAQYIKYTSCRVIAIIKEETKEESPVYYYKPLDNCLPINTSKTESI